MIPPAECFAAHRNIIDRVIDVGREYAQGIERKSDARSIAKSRGDEANRARNLTHAGEIDDLERIRHPMRRDRDESAGRTKMDDPRRQVEECEEIAEEATGHHYRFTQFPESGKAFFVAQYPSVSATHCHLPIDLRCGRQRSPPKLNPHPQCARGGAFDYAGGADGGFDLGVG